MRLAVVASVCCLYASVGASLEVQLPSNAPSVASRAELRAGTNLERAFAEVFDQQGSPLQPDLIPVIIGEQGPPPPPPSPGTIVTPLTPTQALAQKVCGVSVLIGRVTASRVRFNKSETLLFTLSDVNVEAWIRPASSYPSVAIGTIGGTASIGGQQLETVGPKRRVHPDETALIFADELPNSPGAYTLRRSPVSIVARAGSRTVSHPVSRQQVDLRTLSDAIRSVACN